MMKRNVTQTRAGAGSAECPIRSVPHSCSAWMGRPSFTLVEALALDLNALGPVERQLNHANHKARRANVLFRDGSVQGFDNSRHALSLTPEVFKDQPSMVAGLDQLLANADHGFRTGSPADAPRIARK